MESTKEQLSQQQIAALQRVIDKQAIEDLLHDYCNAADRRNYDKMRTLYHDDAWDDHTPFFNGLAKDFIDQLPAIGAPMEILHHNITTTNIRFDPDNANLAQGEVYILAFHQIKTDNGLMDLLVGGRYLDKYEKRDERWGFSYRTIVTDWANIHNPSQVDLSATMLQGSKFGRKDKSDPLYSTLNLFND